MEPVLRGCARRPPPGTRAQNPHAACPADRDDPIDGWDTSQWSQREVEAACTALFKELSAPSAETEVECAAYRLQRRPGNAIALLLALCDRHEAARSFIDARLGDVVDAAFSAPTATIRQAAKGGQPQNIESAGQCEEDSLHRASRNAAAVSPPGTRVRLLHALAELAPLFADTLTGFSVVARCLAAVTHRTHLATKMLQLRWRHHRYLRRDAARYPPAIRFRQKAQARLQLHWMRAEWRALIQLPRAGAPSPAHLTLLLRCVAALTDSVRCSHAPANCAKLLYSGALPDLRWILGHHDGGTPDDGVRPAAWSVLLHAAQQERLRPSLCAHGFVPLIAAGLACGDEEERGRAVDVADVMVEGSVGEGAPPADWVRGRTRPAVEAQMALWERQESGTAPAPAGPLAPGEGGLMALRGLTTGAVHTHTPLDPKPTSCEPAQFVAQHLIDEGVFPLLWRLVRRGPRPDRIGACMALRKALCGLARGHSLRVSALHWSQMAEACPLLAWPLEGAGADAGAAADGVSATASIARGAAMATSVLDAAGGVAKAEEANEAGQVAVAVARRREAAAAVRSGVSSLRALALMVASSEPWEAVAASSLLADASRSRLTRVAMEDAGVPGVLRSVVEACESRRSPSACLALETLMGLASPDLLPAQASEAEQEEQEQEGEVGGPSNLASASHTRLGSVQSSRAQARSPTCGGKGKEESGGEESGASDEEGFDPDESDGGAGEASSEDEGEAEWTGGERGAREGDGTRDAEEDEGEEEEEEEGEVPPCVGTSLGLGNLLPDLSISLSHHLTAVEDGAMRLSSLPGPSAARAVRALDAMGVLTHLVAFFTEQGRLEDEEDDEQGEGSTDGAVVNTGGGGEEEEGEEEGDVTVLPAGYEALARPLRFLTPRQLSRREASLVALSKLSAFDATCALLERAEPLALLSTALRQHALAYTRPDENPLPPGTGEDGDGSDASVFAVATQAACNALAHCARPRHVHRASLVALRAVLAHGAVRPLVALCSLPCTDAAPDWASQDEVEDLAEAALALLSALPPHTGPRGTAVLAGVKEDLRQHMPRNAMEVLRERDPDYAGRLDRIDRFGYSQGVERAKGPADSSADGAYAESSLSLAQRLSLEHARAANALKLQAARDETQEEEEQEHAAAFRALVQTAGGPLLHLFRTAPTRRLRAACAYALSRAITDEGTAGFFLAKGILEHCKRAMPPALKLSDLQQQQPGEDGRGGSNGLDAPPDWLSGAPGGKPPPGPASGNGTATAVAAAAAAAAAGNGPTGSGAGPRRRTARGRGPVRPNASLSVASLSSALQSRRGVSPLGRGARTGIEPGPGTATSAAAGEDTSHRVAMTTKPRDPALSLQQVPRAFLGGTVPRRRIEVLRRTPATVFTLLAALCEYAPRARTAVAEAGLLDAALERLVAEERVRQEAESDLQGYNAMWEDAMAQAAEQEAEVAACEEDVEQAEEEVEGWREERGTSPPPHLAGALSRAERALDAAQEAVEEAEAEQARQRRAAARAVKQRRAATRAGGEVAGLITHTADTFMRGRGAARDAILRSGAVVALASLASPVTHRRARQRTFGALAALARDATLAVPAMVGAGVLSAVQQTLRGWENEPDQTVRDALRCVKAAADYPSGRYWAMLYRGRVVNPLKRLAQSYQVELSGRRQGHEQTLGGIARDILETIMPLLVSVGEGDLDKRVEEDEDEDEDEDEGEGEGEGEDGDEDEDEDEGEDEDEDEDEGEDGRDEHKEAVLGTARRRQAGGSSMPSMRFPLASGQAVQQPVPHRPLVVDPMFRPGPEVDVQAELARVVASQGGVRAPQPEEERGSRQGSRSGGASHGSHSLRMPGLRAASGRGRTRGEVFSRSSLGHEVTIRGAIQESGSGQ